MPFPFTFIFNVPGIINPFVASNPKHFVGTSTIRAPSQAEQERLLPPAQHPQQAPLSIPAIPRSKLSRPRPPLTLEPPSRSPTPVSRKRGWHPAFAEPSISTTTLAATSGYLYSPAHSGDSLMGSIWSQNPQFTNDESDQHDPHEDEEMPPLKKRRGLAGTIISTAVNAALIGGAVGLTVYRLWRNRGRLPQEQPRMEAVSEPGLEALPPPPPYDAPSHRRQDFKAAPHVVPSSPPSSAKKPRQAPRQKRAATQHRRRKSHRTHPDQHSFSDPHLPNPSTRSEFDLQREAPGEEVEDKMDWIGDKLSMLIEQGKRALSTHVVVSSDAKEDEVDDGSDAWEEETDPTRQSRSRSGSVRHCKRPRTLNLGPGPSIPHASSSSPSPRFADFNFPVSSSAPNTSFISGALGGGYLGLPASQSTTSLNNVSIEDPATFESPELRESMERARQRLMARRLGGT